MFLRDQSRAYLPSQFILRSLEGSWQTILGKDRRNLPHFTCHSEQGPFSCCFPGALGDVLNRPLNITLQFRLRNHERHSTDSGHADSQCQIFPKWSLRPWRTSEIKFSLKIHMGTSDFASPQRTLCPPGYVYSGS